MAGGIIREKIVKWKVAATFHNLSLLSFLQKMTQNKFTNRFLKRSIENGFCRLNGSYELFASKKLKTNDLVEMAIGLVEKKKDKKLKPMIFYEDDHLLVIDKPVDLICENDAVSDYIGQKILLAHRLDKRASGLLILAKQKKVFEKMKNLFAKRNVDKTYIALVDKPLKKKKGKIENYLALKRAFQGQKIYGASKRGKHALTYYSLICNTDKLSAVLCKLITGRTHQLRVHLSEMDHPILGDFLYAKKFEYPYFVSRLFLHSYQISFVHPFENKKMEFTSPLPGDFFKVINKLPNSFLRK